MTQSPGPPLASPIMDAHGIPDGMAALEALLTAPGAMFEVGVESIRGETMTTFTRRLRSLREALEASSGFGDREYVVFADRDVRRVVTHAEHLRAVASTARVLREEYGVRAGDRVAILAANCPEWIVAFWAAVSLGAIAVGLNGWWVGDEIRYGIADCDPTSGRRCGIPYHLSRKTLLSTCGCPSLGPHFFPADMACG